MYLIKGDLDKAEEELLISKNIKPIYSKGLNNLGLVYFRQGKIKEAKKLYFEALRQDYPYAGAIENLIPLYLQEKNIEKAKFWMTFLYPNQEELIDTTIKNI